MTASPHEEHSRVVRLIEALDDGDIDRAHALAFDLLRDLEAMESERRAA